MTTKMITVQVEIAYKFDEQKVDAETAQYDAINLALNPNLGTILNKTKLLSVVTSDITNIINLD